MRTIIFILLLMPVIAAAQKQDVYIRLTDAGGKQLNGDVMVKGFEKWMQALTTNSGGKNNTQFSFTMNISVSSADLKRAMNGNEFLSTALVTVTQPGAGRPQIMYTVKMEKIKVTSCNESMGCNNVMTTSVALQATRIGWTYYQTNATGAQTVSNKYGYDAEAGGPWTNF